MAVYPDTYRHPPLVPLDAKHKADGMSLHLPVDTTVPEWLAWQRILKEDDAKKGQNCLTCHQSSDPAEAPSALTAEMLSNAKADARLKTLHSWVTTPDDALENTFGLWVKPKTYRTLLVVTVKVLNYGAGHRAPTTPGSSVTLAVEAVDGEGKPLAFHKGYLLPKEAQGYAGSPGMLYARLYGSDEGALTTKPVPGTTTRVAKDTRLQAGEHDELHFLFLLPEKAKDGEPAWKAKARLIWKPSLAKDAPETVLKEAEEVSPL